MTTAPEFDEGPLKDVEQSLPAADFIAFVEQYLVSAAGHLSRARAHHAAGDHAALAAEAHTLISVTGSYGLAQASMLARQLETACKARDVPQADRLIQALTTAAEGGWAAMRRRFVPTNS